MADTHDVSFRLKLLNADIVKSGLTGLKDEMSGLGRETSKADSHMRRWERVLGTNTSHLQRAIRYASGFAAGLASIGTAEDAVKTTNEFSDAAGTLATTTRLSLENASRWVAAAKTWDISSETLTAGFNQNAKAVETATGQYHTQARALGLLGNTAKDALKRNDLLEKGAGTQAEAFRQLGLSQKDVQEGRTDFQGLLYKEADALEHLKKGTQRASIAQTLWGRGWAELVPILGAGSEAMKEQFGWADKYGVTLHDKTVKSAEEFKRSQLEAKYATLGLQLTLGRLLIPSLTYVRTKFLELDDKVRNGSGKWAQFRGEVSRAAATVRRDANHMLKALEPIALWGLRHAGSLSKIAGAFLALRYGAKALRGLNNATFGALGKAAGKAGEAVGLAGARGSLTNPMYVIVLDKPGAGGSILKTAGKVVSKGAGPLALAGRLGAGALMSGAGLAAAYGVSLGIPAYLAYKFATKPSARHAQATRDAYARQHGGHLPKGWHLDANGFPVKGHAIGGLIGGQGYSDSVPAMLKPGEYVIRREAVQAIGAAALAHLNAGERPGEDARDIHTHVYLDGREIATAITKQARKAKALQ